MEPLRPDDPLRIDEYQLFGRLGDGGMGQVYFGKTPGGKPVAVKVIKPDYAKDSEYLARFASEAAAAKTVSGAFTAAVIDAGPADTPPWLAIDFVFGPSLYDAVAPARKGAPSTPLPADAVWALAGGLVEALRAVHACGLVHRDLKPGNVLLDVNGPKVIDFGIARGQLPSSVHTSPRIVLGTKGYMSPEQAKAEPVGQSSDIFALGCVLVFATTGSNPRTDDRGIAVREQPGLAAAPPELRQLVEWCLAPLPAQRPTLANLMAKVMIGRSRYPQAQGLHFWPAAVDSLVRSKGERIRSSLWQHERDAQAGGNSHPPTQLDHRNDDEYGYRDTEPRPRPDPLLRPGPGPNIRLRLGSDATLFAVYRPRRRAGSVISRRPGEPLDAAAHAMEAERSCARGHYLAAEDAYRESLRLDPQDPVVHVDLGRALYQLKRYGDAEMAFLDALRLAPGIIAARRNRYIVVKEAVGRSQEAEHIREELELACHEVLGLDHDPSDVASCANRGDSLYCLGLDSEAVQSYQAALTLDPGNPRLVEKLDHAMRRTG